jgi:hypothetical protein
VDLVLGFVMRARAQTLGVQTYLVQRTADGVTTGLANGSVDLGSGKAGEEGDDGGLGVHVGGWFVVLGDYPKKIESIMYWKDW